jgi:dipeptidyl aminopeptidase/acylaminoacyl peptidase
LAKAICVLAILLATACDLAPKAKLIHREALFGPPQRVQFRLSPDGKRMSFLAPVDGVLNIWVGPRGDFKAAHPLTHDTGEGISLHEWARNGHTILYRLDRNGNQNWRIHALDVVTGQDTDLTPFEGIQADILALSDAHPDEVLLVMNRRDPRFPDVYRANLATGNVQLVEVNPGFASFVADNDLNVRLALAPTPDGGMTIFERGPKGWSQSGAVPPQDALTFRILGFDGSNQRVYMIDSRGRDTAALTRYTPSTSETEVLGQGDRADIARVLVQPTQNTIQAFSVDYERRIWHVIDPSIEDDLKTLSAFAGATGEFDVVDRTTDDKTWVVHIDKVTEPGAYYLYDRPSRTLHFLSDTRPDLRSASLVPLHATVIRARDGLELVAYYSLPRRADRNQDGKPERKSPLVLVVHGGPWSRDKYGLDMWHQWLANRGYAVLSVNYRGSTGFGKAFLNDADEQWGGGMLHDLEDAAEWAITNGIADPSKIAVMGGRYGGYAAIAGLAFTPSRYACGVSIGGPSNLVTMMTNMPHDWTDVRDILLHRVGDPDTSQGKQLLEAQSPELHAQGIVHPLFLAQGASDPEVSESDAQALVRELKDRGVPVTYVIYPDEGETLSWPADQLSFYAMAEAFLGKCLGGRIEPIGDALKGSSAQVLDGAEFIPGLVKAMAQASGPEPASVH